MNLSKFMTWTQIQRIQEYKALKSMYFWLLAVPVLAKSLNTLNETVTINLFNADFTLNLSLPFSWQVFYFSSLFIVLGDIVFHNKCPNILKDYVSYTSFKNDGKSTTHIEKYAEEINAGLVKTALSQGKIDEEKIQEAFWYVFDEAQKHNTKSRLTASIFYYIGLGLIGIVLFENLWSVIKLTLNAT